MRVTDHQTASALREIAPYSYSAMTHLVMAMANISKNSGKRTLFGRDKGIPAYKKFFERLRNQLSAMVTDSYISREDTDEEVLAKLVQLIQLFSVAHPNWLDAYTVAKELFIVEKSQAIAMISRLR